MIPRLSLPTLAVVVLVALAGCLGGFAGGQPTSVPPGTPVQGTTPAGDGPGGDTDASMPKFVSGAGLCERSNVPTRMTMSQNADRAVVTVTVEGNLSVTDAGRFAPPPTLTQPSPNRYVLWVSTRSDPEREPRPCDGDGHVPYVAELLFPHDGLDEFHLTVMHDGDPVATWGNESV